MKRFKTVDAYIDNAENWRDELVKLRDILTSMDGLVEEVKWGAPCYTVDGKNVVGIGAFKSYFGLWFHQGVFLKDKDNVLLNCQEGKTKALRQWRMSNIKDIKVRQVKSYLKEAIELARQGKEIKPDRSKPVVVPPQLKEALSKNKKAGASFKNLTKGLQREYADYISEAKREETKIKRLTKIIPMIGITYCG